MTDRLYVMNEGAFIAEMKTSDASQEKIMRAIVTAGKVDMNSKAEMTMTDVEKISVGSFIKKTSVNTGILLALAIIMVFFQVMTDGTLMQPLNITNLLLQNSYIVIMALAMLLIIVAGHIDLSVGSVAGFIGGLALF